jgi:hypothetical protein
MDLEHFRDFRSGWPDQNLNALKKLERARAFFRFCQDSDWLPDNPAKKLKNPNVTQPSTMPFTKSRWPKYWEPAKTIQIAEMLRDSGHPCCCSAFQDCESEMP